MSQPEPVRLTTYRLPSTYVVSLSGEGDGNERLLSRLAEALAEEPAVQLTLLLDLLDRHRGEPT